MKYLIIIYLTAFVAANLIVKHYGAPGLWISSFLLIPFDFVARCIIHEKIKGIKLVLLLLCLTIAAGAITLLINHDAVNIALASICGFTAVQVVAGIFYQININRSWFIKVNITDFIAIVVDSIIFQFVAFNLINIDITAGQILIKFAGGLLWYYLLFKKLKINEKINRS